MQSQYLQTCLVFDFLGMTWMQQVVCDFVDGHIPAVHGSEMLGALGKIYQAEFSFSIALVLFFHVFSHTSWTLLLPVNLRQTWSDLYMSCALPTWTIVKVSCGPGPTQ